MHKPKLLVVSYFFPPVGGVHVNRVLSFVRHLPENGLEVHVLTPRNPVAAAFDPGLLEKVPQGVRVHRTFTPELPFRLRKMLWSGFAPARNGEAGDRPPAATQASGVKGMVRRIVRNVMVPDPQVVWTHMAVRAASRIVSRHGIDAVLVTAPPFSSFLIGCALKRQFPHLCFISDFRDDWLRYYLTSFEFLKDDAIRKRAERIQRETVESADLVVAVTRSCVAHLRDMYRSQPEEKFLFLPNGYEPEMFGGFTPRPHGKGDILVTHTGTVFEATSPDKYLDALDRLPDEIRSRFVTRFVGRVAENCGGVFANRRSRIELVPFVPQKEVARYLEESDYLLSLVNRDYVLPAKTFEYLATGKPILAVAPANSELDRLLQDTGTGWCGPSEDLGAIAEMLAAAACGRLRPARDEAKIGSYSRTALAARLAAEIRSRVEVGCAP